MDDFPITIYHNPECETSRNVLAMIRASHYEPSIVFYIDVGWTQDLLRKLFLEANLTPREALRLTKLPDSAANAACSAYSDSELISAMITHPILVNRPFVVTPLGTRLCRPSEVVLELLEQKPALFVKEDGSQVKTELKSSAEST